MKKLIALFAVTALASTGALASVAISGAASVSYDDNGTAASATTYDADLTIVGTGGGTTVTVVTDVDASWALTSVDMATTIGPVTIAADMHDETNTTTDDGDGDIKTDGDDRSVTVSLSAPVGDLTISLDDDGDITLGGTWAGVTLSHNIDDDDTTGSASIAGMDVSITNDGGSTTWSIGTTVSGVALTLDSENDVTAAFGLAGNTLTVSHFGARAVVAATATHYSTESAAAYTTAAVSRDLTSGATLTATYDTGNDSLTLKAAVAF